MGRTKRSDQSPGTTAGRVPGTTEKGNALTGQ
jgi:hypothetical protein